MSCRQTQRVCFITPYCNPIQANENWVPPPEPMARAPGARSPRPPRRGCSARGAPRSAGGRAGSERPPGCIPRIRWGREKATDRSGAPNRGMGIEPTPPIDASGGAGASRVLWNQGMTGPSNSPNTFEGTWSPKEHKFVSEKSRKVHAILQKKGISWLSNRCGMWGKHWKNTYSIQNLLYCTYIYSELQTDRILRCIR